MAISQCAGWLQHFGLSLRDPIHPASVPCSQHTGHGRDSREVLNASNIMSSSYRTSSVDGVAWLQAQAVVEAHIMIPWTSTSATGESQKKVS